MDKSIIYLAIAGYLGAMFKTNIAELFYLIKERTMHTLSVVDTDKVAYSRLLEWIGTVNSVTFNKNKKFVIKYDTDDDCDKVVTEMGSGRLFHRFGWFTWMYAYHYREKLNDAYIWNVYIMILGKNSDKIAEDVKKYMSKDIDQYCKIFDSKTKQYTRLPNKSFNDIFSNEVDKLKSHVDAWTEMHQMYEERGITHKFGMLLYGPPGTGKTSMIVALANYLHYNVAVIGKSHINSLNNIRDIKRCIIVFEDIDCICDEKKGEDLHKLLQFMDGIESPSDTIIVLTTNYKENLDERLLRPGRIQLELHLDLIEKDLAVKMCKSFDMSLDILDDETFPINPSYLQNKILNTKLTSTANRKLELVEKAS